LHGFRDSLYRCFGRRADALFELTDAILTAGSVPSPPHLSLAPIHRRGWGSLYAALSKGRIDENAIRGLMARHPMARDNQERTPVYAVDVTSWPRCDAEASPERGYYYHPSSDTYSATVNLLIDPLPSVSSTSLRLSLWQHIAVYLRHGVLLSRVPSGYGTPSRSTRPSGPVLGFVSYAAVNIMREWLRAILSGLV
jgi:hypothetical protein